jgi:Tol biopolymer transport system component
MGQCYEKLGDAQARTAYEQVVRDFGDQKEAVEQARALLSATGQARHAESAVTAQQKWVLPTGQNTQMRHISADGRYIPFQRLGGLWLHDFTTGEDRSVIKRQGEERLDSPELSPDTRQLAYSRIAPENGQSSFQLRVTSVDGSQTRTLIDNKERWIWPKGWSPDVGDHQET